MKMILNKILTLLFLLGLTIGFSSCEKNEVVSPDASEVIFKSSNSGSGEIDEGDITDDEDDEEDDDTRDSSK